MTDAYDLQIAEQRLKELQPQAIPQRKLGFGVTKETQQAVIQRNVQVEEYKKEQQKKIDEARQALKQKEEYEAELRAVQQERSDYEYGRKLGLKGKPAFGLSEAGRKGYIQAREKVARQGSSSPYSKFLEQEQKLLADIKDKEEKITITEIGPEIIEMKPVVDYLPPKGAFGKYLQSSTIQSEAYLKKVKEGADQNALDRLQRVGAGLAVTGAGVVNLGSRAIADPVDTGKDVINALYETGFEAGLRIKAGKSPVSPSFVAKAKETLEYDPGYAFGRIVGEIAVGEAAGKSLTLAGKATTATSQAVRRIIPESAGEVTLTKIAKIPVTDEGLIGSKITFPESYAKETAQSIARAEQLERAAQLVKLEQKQQVLTTIEDMARQRLEQLPPVVKITDTATGKEVTLGASAKAEAEKLLSSAEQAQKITQRDILNLQSPISSIKGGATTVEDQLRVLTRAEEATESTKLSTQLKKALQTYPDKLAGKAQETLLNTKLPPIQEGGLLGTERPVKITFPSSYRKQVFSSIEIGKEIKKIEDFSIGLKKALQQRLLEEQAKRLRVFDTATGKEIIGVPSSKGAFEFTFDLKKTELPSLKGNELRVTKLPEEPKPSSIDTEQPTKNGMVMLQKPLETVKVETIQLPKLEPIVKTVQKTKQITVKATASQNLFKKKPLKNQLIFAERPKDLFVPLLRPATIKTSARQELIKQPVSMFSQTFVTAQKFGSLNRTANRSLSRQDQLKDQIKIQRPAFSFALGLRPLMRQDTRSRLRPFQETKKIQDSNKPLRLPSIKEDRPFVRRQRFRVLVRRKGKFRAFGLSDSFSEAIAKGSKATDRSLARTFKVQALDGLDGLNTPLLTRYRLPKGRTRLTDPFTFIQKAKFSLSSAGEQREIKLSRQKQYKGVTLR